MTVGDLKPGDQFRTGVGNLYVVVSAVPAEFGQTVLSLDMPELSGERVVVPYRSEDTLEWLGWTVE